ncbi:hypothetical protein [Streptomyces virginiae]|uniref:hypothetical protein n=1 Tax=Streptomyces virginiae TaxID=1961 RepID=UPI00341FAE2E
MARFIAEALGDARTVLDVGAGAGSYESAARAVTAVDASESMRARRPVRLAGRSTRSPRNCPSPMASSTLR